MSITGGARSVAERMKQQEERIRQLERRLRGEQGSTGEAPAVFIQLYSSVITGSYVTWTYQNTQDFPPINFPTFLPDEFLEDVIIPVDGMYAMGVSYFWAAGTATIESHIEIEPPREAGILNWTNGITHTNVGEIQLWEHLPLLQGTVVRVYLTSSIGDPDLNTTFRLVRTGAGRPQSGTGAPVA